MAPRNCDRLPFQNEKFEGEGAGGLRKCKVLRLCFAVQTGGYFGCGDRAAGIG